MPKQKVGAQPRSAAQPAGGMAARPAVARRPRPRLLREGRAAQAAQSRLCRQLERHRAGSELGTVRRVRRSRSSTSRPASATKVVDRADDRYVRASPDGKYLLFYIDGQFWTIDTATRAPSRTSRRPSPTSFVDKESDSTDVQRPLFGVAGWTKGDATVMLYDKFDIWQVAAERFEGDAADRRRRRTGRHRYARSRSARKRPSIRSKPIYLATDRHRGRRSPATRGSRPARRRPKRWCGSTRASTASRRRRTPTSTTTSSRASTIRRTRSSAARISRTRSRSPRPIRSRTSTRGAAPS